MIKNLMISFFLLMVCISSYAQSFHAKSADTQIALLELFTAEGCGLCPAADRWVHHLPEQGYNDDKVIVLGFHVDYLNDKKGWVDRFASPVFSDRQRQLARLNLYQTIYTPEFVISGEVIHNWRKYTKNVVDAVNSFKPEADIALTVISDDNVKQLFVNAIVHVDGEQNKLHSKLYLAVVENDVKNKVLGGDNVGVTFNHQNLVRQWLGPFDISLADVTTKRIDITIAPEWILNQMSLVAVVQNLNDGFVLQSLKLPLK